MSNVGSSPPPGVDPFKEDFKAFLWAVWKFLGLPDPTPVQYDMADYLQHGPKRKVIMAFRGVGKSWITATFALWMLYCDPQKKILVVSASKQRADDFSTFCMRLLHDMPLLRHLHPRDDQRSSKIAFDVRPAKADHSPSVKSAGITGQITGSRADHIIADDIEVTNNSDTQMARDKLRELVKEFDAILKPLPDSQITYLGTPQCEESLYNELPDRGYAVRIWPARIPENTEKYGIKLAPFIAELMEAGAESGDAVDPRRFDHEDLEERLLSYGRSGFALQFQLDTSLSDADKYPLKLSDLIVMGLDANQGPTNVIWAREPERHLKDLPTVGLAGDRYYAPMVPPKDYTDYTGSVMFVDPSGRGKDETSWAIVNMLHGKLFLMNVEGHKGGFDDDLLKLILRRAKYFKVKLIQVEPNFGGGMFAKLLGAHRSEIYDVTIEDADWATTQKEARIIGALEPVMNQHRLVVNTEVVESDYESTTGYPMEDQQRYRLFYQMTRLTRDKGALIQDDRLDAVAGAVQYWVDHMGRNERKAYNDHKQEKLDRELRKIIEHAQGRKIDRRCTAIRQIKCLRDIR